VQKLVYLSICFSFLLFAFGCDGTQGQNTESEILPKVIRPEAKNPEGIRVQEGRQLAVTKGIKIDYSREKNWKSSVMERHGFDCGSADW